MKRMVGWLILIVVAGVGLIAVYYATQQAPPVSEPPLAQAPVPQETPSAPTIRYPIERKPHDEKLPPLDASDIAVKDAISGLLSSERALQRLFQFSGFIRRVIATVDNLPRRKVALRLMPVKPVPDPFRTTGSGESLAVGPNNAARYRTYVQLAEKIDSAKLVSLYVRFYPLFQQAYEELGYPGAYFNDRLVEVIDHLLAAPEAPVPTRLVQPKVFYEFADPELEARSAGEKILLRIGNENATILKAKLREIRGELVGRAPSQ